MSLQEFKCPNCGGPLVFDAGVQEMTCPYCDSVIAIDALIDMTKDRANAKDSQPPRWGYESQDWTKNEEDGLVVYSCRSCAGEIVGDESLGAATCPFCGSPVVMISRFAGALRPDIVIPFKKSKEEAIAALKAHYLNKKLLPAIFKDENRLQEIKGVYVPFWLFDAEVDADVEYRATRVRHWMDSKYSYTETQVYRVLRSGGIAYERVPVDGSQAIDDVLMQSIEPFDISQAIPFKTAYLAGFFANKYDVNEDESEKRANERIKKSTEGAFAATVRGYATVTAGRTDIKLRSGKAQYALLPVWFLSTRWQDRGYTFAMNGQTGKFVGDLPLDKRAYWATFFKTFSITAAALLAVVQFFFKVVGERL